MTEDDDKALDEASNTLMAAFAKYITEFYGERCSMQQPGCELCKMWALYDLVYVMMRP